MASISIVIGTRNRLEVLIKCLDSLIGKINVEHEIIIIDAGSTDGTLDYVGSFPGIHLMNDGNPLGQSKSFNRVLKTLNSKYICWLSDDNVLLDGMIDSAVRILESHQEIGMVALKVKDVSGPNSWAPYIGGISSLGILTCNQGVIRSQLFRKVGFFDEEIIDYGIDAFLTAKVLLAGYKVVYTKKVAIHHYRDHEKLPGAIDNKGRAQKSRAAKELYHQKYRHRFQSNLIDNAINRSTQVVWTAIYMLVKIAYRIGLRVNNISGYNSRDLHNILHGRYISFPDLWKNRNKPFYLVQEIPRNLLK